MYHLGTQVSKGKLNFKKIMKTFKILCLVLVVCLIQSLQSQEAFEVEVSGTAQTFFVFRGIIRDINFIFFQPFLN